MNCVKLQYWENSIRSDGVYPYGCSIHYEMNNHSEYINSIYDNRDINNIPNEYARKVGNLIDVYIKDELYMDLMNKGTIKLEEYEMNNLIKLKEFIICF